MVKALLALRCLPSTSILPTIKTFSTTSFISAISTAHLPKRDVTEYGVPRAIPKKDWPIESETNFNSHPLWKFFHTEIGSTARGVSLEAPDKRIDNSSRSWTAFELRRKSFEELHSLWYILLRERNVLLTQREEARRIRLDLRGFTSAADKLRMVQKSMARVKQVLSERRHAIISASKILRARGEADAADLLLKEGEKFENDLEAEKDNVDSPSK